MAKSLPTFGGKVGSGISLWLNKDLFIILCENGIITPETESAMVKMARFRNSVVHDHARIDPEIVIGILREGVDDFKAFSNEILSFMDKLTPA